MSEPVLKRYDTVKLRQSVALLDQLVSIAPLSRELHVKAQEALKSLDSFLAELGRIEVLDDGA